MHTTTAPHLTILPKRASPPSRLLNQFSAVSLAACLAFSGCANPNAPGSSTASAALTNCAVGGVAGAGLSALVQKLTDPKKKLNTAQMAKVAAAGCVVGLAATVVGQQLNKSQQERQDRAFQTAAARQANPGAAPPPAPAPTRQPPAAAPTPARPAPNAPAPVSPAAPQSIGAAQWNDGGSTGGAAPTGPVVSTSDGNQCVPMKEWAQVNGKYVEQEVQACRPMADASGQFQRVVPKA